MYITENNSEQIHSKSLIRFAEVLQVEDNLETSSKNEISRNSMGRRIKVRLFEDPQRLTPNELPWVWPLMPKHLHIMPKVGEMVMIILQYLDGAKGNRFYVGPIISQDYYLDHGGRYESLSLLQGESTKPLCHPSGDSVNDGTYPDSDTIAIQGRGDSAMWLKDEELRLMCGHKPYWKQTGASVIKEGADPGSLTFNKKSVGYIQMKYGNFIDNSVKEGSKEFNSVVNIVSDRINLISHSGADRLSGVNVTDQKELIDKSSIENFVSNGQCMVYGNELIDFLNKFRQIFAEHTHHWLYDLQVVCEKDKEFWNKDLNELLCKTIKIE